MPPRHYEWRTLQHQSKHGDIFGGLQKKENGLTYAIVANNIKSVLSEVAKAFGRVRRQVFGKLGHIMRVGYVGKTCILSHSRSAKLCECFACLY